MANVLKDNGIDGTPIPLLPTGEQQIVVSILRFFFLVFFIAQLVFLYSQGRLSYSTNDRRRNSSRCNYHFS